MAILNVPNSFSAGTPAVASQVNANFTAVKNFAEAITAGSNIDNGAIVLAKLASDILNKLVPVGTIVAYAGATAPAGWLLCDGATSVTSFPALQAILGTATTPNLKGRALVGKDTVAPFNGALLSVLGSTTSVSSHSHTLTGTAQAAGGHSHNITVDPNGSHTHTFTTSTNGDHNHTNAVESSGTTHSHLTGGTAGSTSGSNTEGSDGTAFNGDHFHSGTTATDGSHSHSASSSSEAAHSHTLSGTADSTGVADGNIQPSALVTYIIKHD